MRSSALVCVVGVLLVAAVVGDVATLVYGHCCRGAPVKEVGKGWPAGAQLVVGGALLVSALLLFVAACLLPARAPSLCQLWLGVHVTWGDDWARLAVEVLHDLQVQPVVDALGLTAVAATVKDASYWWWFVQGLFIHGLVRLAVSCGAEEEADEEEGKEENDEMTEMMVGDTRPPAIETAQNQLALCPAPPRPATITIEEIG